VKISHPWATTYGDWMGFGFATAMVTNTGFHVSGNVYFARNNYPL